MSLAKINKALTEQIAQLESEMSELRQRADKDDLTGCLRRKAFFDLLDKRKRFGLLPSHVSLCILDLDHFKNINDTYGHAVGDEVLIETVNTIKNNIPNGTLLGRFGGEEFVLILPHAPAAALPTIEKIRNALERTAIKVGRDQSIKVTASIGVTSWHSDRPLIEAIRDADLKLYHAKNAGRNQIAA